MATNIDFVLGMPPSLPNGDSKGTQGRTNTVMRNSMPIARIYPGIPSFQRGLDLFQRVRAFKEGDVGGGLAYHPILQEHGFTLSDEVHRGFLEIAYLADSFPTDSFTNEYGENFLQKFTDVASEGAASISQMFGGRRATDVVTGATRALLGEGAGDVLENVGGRFSNFIQALPLGGTIGGAGALVNRLLAGSRIDFPMVWKTSGFQPSYTMTIRLYNPNPSNVESTRKYIAGPIAALMLLGIPLSEDGATYSWPFIHRIYSPGIFDLDPAFISNITVIKGGDQQQIGYTQQLGMVDVRIDFGSLFSTILAGRGNIGKTRPTLEKYIDSLLGQKRGVFNFSSQYGEGGRVITDEAVNPEIVATTADTAPTQAEVAAQAEQERVNAANAQVSSDLRTRTQRVAPGVLTPA